MEGARRLAAFAKVLFAKSDRNYTRENVFELFEKKYGALPVNNEYENELSAHEVRQLHYSEHKTCST